MGFDAGGPMRMGFGFAITLAMVGCRDATAIELQISTDLRCEDVRVVTTSIGAGALETYQARPPNAVTTRCDEATGHIGSLVLLPHDDDSAEVAVRVITARKSKAPEECLNRATRECIIAHRVVRFVPHRLVTLPIRMENACSGVVCGARETCTDGRCVSAIARVAACAVDGCEATVPTPASRADSGPPPPPMPPTTNADAGVTKDGAVAQAHDHDDAGPRSSDDGGDSQQQGEKGAGGPQDGNLRARVTRGG